MIYVYHIGVLIAIYAILAVSLDLLVGETGLLSIAQAAFFGVGAYASAILSTRFGLSFGCGLVVGMVTAGIISLFIAFASRRVAEDYFAIATFGFQIIASSVFTNWTTLTHGPLGISGVPQPVLFGWNVRSELDFAILCTGFLWIAAFIVARISSSPFGRVLRAIREEEIFAQAYGKNTFYFKICAFAVSAALAACAGTLYAHYIAFVDPTTFTVMDSILIVSMVIIGGADTRFGPLLGAVLIVAVPEILRFVGLPNDAAANVRAIVYGILLIVVIRFRPKGLLGYPRRAS